MLMAVSKRHDAGHDELVPMAYVMHRLAVSRGTVYRLESEGRLKSVRYSATGHRRFIRSQVDALATGAAA
jgi:excisionase family DNA binding protein